MDLLAGALIGATFMILGFIIVRSFRRTSIEPPIYNFDLEWTEPFSSEHGMPKHFLAYGYDSTAYLIVQCDNFLWEAREGSFALSHHPSMEKAKDACVRAHHQRFFQDFGIDTTE